MKKNVAAVVLLNDEKKLLLYLRDDKKDIPDPNCWCILGGHAEKNEEILETLRREIKEEIDFDISEPIFLGKLKDCTNSDVYIFRERINKKIEDIVLTEGQKLGYFTFNEALKLNLPEELRDFFIENKNKILS